jgi:hypothetical protein
VISFIRFNEFSFFSTTFLLEKVDGKKKKKKSLVSMGAADVTVCKDLLLAEWVPRF